MEIGLLLAKGEEEGVSVSREERKRKTMGLRGGSLNDGTMTGEAGDMVDMMQRMKVNILSVQETRWKGSKA